jgi:hypothetical protein
MAKQFPHLDERHRDFIRRQRIFFTASAAPGTRVNVSPRSTDMLRVLDQSCVIYLDRTGSGNETAAHLRADGRLTIMFCAVEGPPMILRLYGRGRILHRTSAAYAGLLATQFSSREPLGARQIVRLDIDLVQTSCGYGVPLFDYQGERPSMDRWAEEKGEAGLAAYQREKNIYSMDGQPTGLLDPDAPTGGGDARKTVDLQTANPLTRRNDIGRHLPARLGSLAGASSWWPRGNRARHSVRRERRA